MNLATCRNILIYGGSFDPPHVAHIEQPRRVMAKLGADAVAYVPAALPPHKRDIRQTPAEHRLAMLQLALRDQPHAVILTDELDRAADGRPSYTVDTLEALHQRLGPHVAMRLLIGGDQLRIFGAWRKHERIIELAEPVVMVRPPDTRQSLLAALPPSLDPAAWAARLIDIPPMDVSATLVRQRVARGQPLAGLVCREVERYIAEQGLYRSEGDR